MACVCDKFSELLLANIFIVTVLSQDLCGVAYIKGITIYVDKRGMIYFS